MPHCRCSLLNQTRTTKYRCQPARSCSTECVRLKNFVTNAQIMDNTIKYCGVYDFAFNEGGQNGEGVYIGTSNKQVRHVLHDSGSTEHTSMRRLTRA